MLIYIGPIVKQLSLINQTLHLIPNVNHSDEDMTAESNTGGLLPSNRQEVLPTPFLRLWYDVPKDQTRDLRHSVLHVNIEPKANV